MKFTNWILMLIRKVCAAVGFTGRASSSNREDNTIKLGIIAPLTGDEAEYGKSGSLVGLALELGRLKKGKMGI